MRERDEDVVDPLSGSGVLVGSGQSQASHSAVLVDLKFLASPPVGAASVVVDAVVVGVVVDVVASVVVVDAVVGVGVVVAAVVVVSPPSVAVVAAGVVASVEVADGVVPSCVVGAGVVPQQSRACSSVQVGRVVVDAASREATQAAKRTTATFIFSIFLDFLSLS